MVGTLDVLPELQLQERPDRPEFECDHRNEDHGPGDPEGGPFSRLPPGHRSRLIRRVRAELVASQAVFGFVAPEELVAYRSYSRFLVHTTGRPAWDSRRGGAPSDTCLEV